MFGFFAWLRLGVKNALIGGVNDGLAELHAQQADAPEMLTVVFAPGNGNALTHEAIDPEESPALQSRNGKKKSGS